MDDEEEDWSDDWCNCGGGCVGDCGGDGYWTTDSDGRGSDDGLTVDIQIENLFYEGEDLRRLQPEKSLELLEECVRLETDEKGDEIRRRFRALEYIVMLHFQLGDMEKTITRYRELLSYMHEVAVAETTESISSILDRVSDSQDFDFLQEIYELTLDKLLQIPEEEVFLIHFPTLHADVIQVIVSYLPNNPAYGRLHFNISMKLCKIQLEKESFDDVRKLLCQMHKVCTLPSGKDDPTKGTQLLKIYAVEIQLMLKVGDTVRLKELFEKAKILDSEIIDPRSMSVIRECAGKMFAAIDKWRDAYGEFYHASLCYQEIGHHKAKQCLEYTVVANMMLDCESNPFDARDARGYERDSEIPAMENLRLAYANDDIKAFEALLQVNTATITSDPFIKYHVDILLNRIRSRACVKLIKPYKRIYINYLARRLNMSNDEVESIVVNLILDEVIFGKVDQINGFLDLRFIRVTTAAKYNAINEWSANLSVLSFAMTSRAATNSPDMYALGMGI